MSTTTPITTTTITTTTPLTTENRSEGTLSDATVSDWTMSDGTVPVRTTFTDPPISCITDLVGAARQLGPTAAEHAERHDREGTFVAESVELLRSTGYLAAPVPTDLGGGGARLSDIVWAQAELARHDAATALATSMHLHVVATAAWRWRRGQTGTEALLRRVVDGAIVATSGGNDFTAQSTVAVPVDGGYLVSGTKRFVSLSPVADLLVTSAIVEPRQPEVEIIGFTVPFASPGVRVVENWDTQGMRGTASNDVRLDDVFVADEMVSGRRLGNRIDPPLAGALAHAIPIVTGTYLGVAEGARDVAIEAARRAGRSDEASLQLAGRVDTAVRTARWALDGLLAEMTDDPAPTLATFTAVQQAKWLVLRSARDAVEAATELIGGAAYRRGHPLERASRDVAAGVFHPIGPSATLIHAGRAALEVDADQL